MPRSSSHTLSSLKVCCSYCSWVTLVQGCSRIMTLHSYPGAHKTTETMQALASVPPGQQTLISLAMGSFEGLKESLRVAFILAIQRPGRMLYCRWSARWISSGTVSSCTQQASPIQSWSLSLNYRELHFPHCLAAL